MYTPLEQKGIDALLCLYRNPDDQTALADLRYACASCPVEVYHRMCSRVTSWGIRMGREYAAQEVLQREDMH